MENKLIIYQSSNCWTASTLPDTLKDGHRTPPATWQRLRIIGGRIKYWSLAKSGQELSAMEYSAKHQPPFMQPDSFHRIEAITDDLNIVLDYYCIPADYFQKKYELSAPHPEVKETIKYIHAGEALDLGCGRGRNSVFLQNNGFNVTALDRSEAAINKLKAISLAEKSCANIKADIYNIEEASITTTFDLILATVVFQFITPKCVAKVIDNMQRQTKPAGINVIVAPVSTSQCPCPIAFPFTFQEHQLKDFYKGWQLLKYNEDLGKFQRRDQNGNQYQSKFATLIARKTNLLVT